MSTLVVCLVAFFAPPFWAFVKSLSQPKSARESFSFPFPDCAVSLDLCAVFSRVKEKLGGHDWKGTAFPIKIDLTTSNSWASQKDATEITCGLLEKKGWVVFRDKSCGPNEVMVDLPRKNFAEKMVATPSSSLTAA